VARVPQIGFAYVKATEGGHFFTFCRPALEQARHFLDVLPREPDTLPPAVDVELGGNCTPIGLDREVEDTVSLWLETVARATGREPIVYATHEAYDRFLRSPRLRRRVWIRDIWWEPRLAQVDPWALWQFDARARVAGIPAFVDLDVFSGSQAELRQF